MSKVIMKPTSVIKARLGLNPGGKVHKVFTKTCADTMDKYVPFRTGVLATTKIVQTDKIIYPQKYAHYMYKGKVMGPNIPIKENGLIVGWFSPKGKKKEYTGADIKYSKAKHHYAGSYWDKRMWSADKDKVIKTVQNYIKTHGGK